MSIQSQSSSSMHGYHFPPPHDQILLDALGEQDVCYGLDNRDHQPAPSNVQLVRMSSQGGMSC